MSDDLPRFAASREYLRRYGDSWSSWAFLATGAAFLGLQALAFADAADAPAGDVLPALLAFSFWAFLAGGFASLLWSGLRDDARERQQVLDALEAADADAEVTWVRQPCPVCGEVLEDESGVLEEWTEHVEGHGLEVHRGGETA